MKIFIGHGFRKIFEQLRQKRKELADKAGVPPYAVFPDKTLMEMATFFPETEDDFLNTFGVGRTKLEKYGSEFMALIRDYRTAHAISEVPERKIQPLAVAENSPKDKRHFQVGRLYREMNWNRAENIRADIKGMEKSIVGRSNLQVPNRHDVSRTMLTN